MFPARAGMNRRTLQRDRPPVPVPRPRGDEGGALPPSALRRHLFPARAGMNRTWRGGDLIHHQFLDGILPVLFGCGQPPPAPPEILGPSLLDVMMSAQGLAIIRVVRILVGIVLERNDMIAFQAAC